MYVPLDAYSGYWPRWDSPWICHRHVMLRDGPRGDTSNFVQVQAGNFTCCIPEDDAGSTQHPLARLNELFLTRVYRELLGMICVSPLFHLQFSQHVGCTSQGYGSRQPWSPFVSVAQWPKRRTSSLTNRRTRGKNLGARKLGHRPRHEFSSNTRVPFPSRLK